MKEFNQILKAQAVTIVNATNTAVSVKSGSLPVFATPMMVALMEEATCFACAPLLDDGETTVGTKINVSHDKASAAGTTVTAFASLEEVDGRRLVFSVYAKDDSGDIIGKGAIERFVVISDKFMKRVNK
ncbi:MAG: thioesterase family protein [Eubacterium sp.]